MLTAYRPRRDRKILSFKPEWPARHRLPGEWYEVAPRLKLWRQLHPGTLIGYGQAKHEALGAGFQRPLQAR